MKKLSALLVCMLLLVLCAGCAPKADPSAENLRLLTSVVMDYPAEGGAQEGEFAGNLLNEADFRTAAQPYCTEAGVTSAWNKYMAMGLIGMDPWQWQALDFACEETGDGNFTFTFRLEVKKAGETVLDKPMSGKARCSAEGLVDYWALTGDSELVPWEIKQQMFPAE